MKGKYSYSNAQLFIFLSDFNLRPLTSPYKSLQLCASMPACITVSLHVPVCFFSYMCVSSPLCSSVRPAVCLLYLVYLLQESRLPGAGPSLQIRSVGTPSSPGGPHVFLMIWLCACCVICSISFMLCLTSCAYWFYLCSSPGLPAAEQSLNISSLRFKTGWEAETSTRCLSVRDMFFVLPTIHHQKTKWHVHLQILYCMLKKEILHRLVHFWW